MSNTFRRRLALGAAALAAATGVFAMVPPATAGPCGLRDEIAAALAEQFSERVAAAGLTGSGEMLEVFVSAGGTWTIVVTRRGGAACVVAAGPLWVQVETPKEPES